jgi:hypothetical protein
MYRVLTRSILVITGTNMYQTHFKFSSGSIRHIATLTSLRRTLLPVNVVEDELKSVLCAVWPLIGLGGGDDDDNDSECRSVICAVRLIIFIPSP